MKRATMPAEYGPDSPVPSCFRRSDCRKQEPARIVVFHRTTMKQSRRHFLSRAAMLAAATGFSLPSRGFAAEGSAGKFKLRFAPHPGMFKAHAGEDVIDQIKFAADQGFTAWEDNGLPGRSPEMQEKIGNTLRERGMTMGVFVAYANTEAPTFARANKTAEEEVLEKIKASVDIAKRVGAKWMTVVPGAVDQKVRDSDRYTGNARLAEGYQTANAIALLRRCAEILEPEKLVMVLEPLNWHANHGGVFLRHSDHAYAICKAVNSPACKILFDIYHQQISEGNLIPNIDLCWDEIGYFQAGDNPGRKEPGTGEIHYANVFAHIARRFGKTGSDMIIGMEHGNSLPDKDGELAVIAAYREVDAR
jgi:hydroxypyruvate isomerase